jgi:alkylation response protein AidB-like acyl-CoA dehydrogenase
MDFGFTQEQEMLRTSARDFLTTECPPELVKQMAEDEKGYKPEMWAKMAELGWQGLAIPEQYDGMGMTFLDLAVLLEEMGRAVCPGPFFSTVVLAGMTILEAEEGVPL